MKGKIMSPSNASRRTPDPATTREIYKYGILWKMLKRLNPRKIIQIGLESKDAIQILLTMGRLLQRQKNPDSSQIYALARNPMSYLSAVQAIKNARFSGLVQVSFGLSLPREEINRLSVEDRSILCGDSSQKKAGSKLEAAKYLPDGFISWSLEDFEFDPDLIVFSSMDPIVNAEIEAIKKRLKSSTYFFLTPLPPASQLKSMKRLLGLQSLPDAARLYDRKGILFKLAVKENKKTTGGETQNRSISLKPPPKNVAIVLLEHFGDIVACEPVSRYVRSMYPTAHITWITKEIYREIVEDNPYVDEVLTIECITEWSLLSRTGIYDKIIDLHIDNRECPICSLPARKWRQHRNITLENYYNHGPLLTIFSTYAGLPALDDAPRVYIPDRVRDRVNILSLPREFIVFHCLSNEYSRDWADEKWLELAQQLNEVWGSTIVEIGTKSCLAEHAVPNFINLCGRVSILESAEIIRRAKVFVGIDSGPAHLGNAVGTYGIVLLGDYKAFRRYVPFTGDYASGKNAKLLYAKTGPARQISVREVLKEIQRVLKRAISGRTPALRSGDVSTKHTYVYNPGTKEDHVRLIAFYLPQFHPITENDRWWGRGFTDWRNVMQGKPLFEDHYQPHFPGELGFYDLRVHEVMCRQAEMARQANIAGFCFWHYWFKGKLLLERPLMNLLDSGKPDFPFCLAWANENWTRRWDGQEKEVLMQQDYGGPKDDQRHFVWLAQFFRDRRYLKIQDRPLFLIYRPFHMRDAGATLARWRKMARQEGIGDPFFMAIRTNLDSRAKVSTINMGFDGELAFQPNSPDTYFSILGLTTEMHRLFPELFSEEIRLLNSKGATVCEYGQAWPIMASSPIVQSSSSTCIVPSWDNSARRINQGAFILDNSKPSSYQRWLRFEIERCLKEPQKPQVLFINAWNEWAEGNHLESDLRYGDSFLEATRRAMQNVQKSSRESRESLEWAIKNSQIQPLIRRVVKAIHRDVAVKESSEDAGNVENLLARIAALLPAVDQGDSRKKQRSRLLIPVIQEFLKTYPATPLLTQLYNQASAFVLNNRKEAAEWLFSLLADVTDTISPELCGKSHYKLAMLSRNTEETIRHLAKCVRVYPEHRVATDLLNKLRKKDSGKKKAKIRTRSGAFLARG